MNQQQIQWAFTMLGLNEYATAEQAKHAYRLLCKQYHPDRNNSNDTLQIYLQIQQAYEIVCCVFELKQQQNRHISFPSSNTNISSSAVQIQAVNSMTGYRILGNDESAKQNYDRMQQRHKELQRLQRWETAAHKEKEQHKQKTYESFQNSRKLPSQQENEKRKHLQTKREAERIAGIIQQLLNLN